MNTESLFIVSMVMSFIASGTVTKLFVIPKIKTANREIALTALVMPHAFRFIGLSFLIPGVVSPTLSPAFAAPAAYGDLVSAVMAVITIWALVARAPFRILLVWIFNIYGMVDLLHALYLGQIGVHVSPSALGAAYFIPTLVVPMLLMTHGVIFWVLFRKHAETL